MRGWLGQFRTIRGRRNNHFETVYVRSNRGKMPRSSVPPRLEIPLRTVCHIILKARQFSQRDFDIGSDDAFNASDGVVSSAFEERGTDAVEEELLSIIADLNEDEQIDLMAIAWLGRGDAGIAGWRALHVESRRRRNTSMGRYLLSDPLLASYLETGLTLLGLSCAEYDESKP